MAAKPNGAGSAPQIGRNLGFCQTGENLISRCDLRL
jgi:hypothetical protein